MSRILENMTELDVHDKKILRELQRNADLTVAEIGERVGLSISPCWRRIDRLERDGVIRGKVSLVDRRKIGLNVQIFVQVKLNFHNGGSLEQFCEAMRGFPEVIDAHIMMGNMGLMLRVVAPDIDAYEKFFLQKLAKIPGVQDVHSNVALSEIKSTTELPVW